MKALNYLLICLTTLAFNSASGQQPPAPPTTNQIKDAKAAPPDVPALTKFNLDFPGGTPGELVAAIQKAMGKPLNATIPDEYADARVPALKMNHVDVEELFRSLGISGNFFEASGRITDDSVWSYHWMRPGWSVGKACRFYSLAPYLERGLTVDDITTAIQTGWKMMGEGTQPTISFHKETKLLIAVGERSKLETIDAALMALEPPPQTEEQAKIKARQQEILDRAPAGK